MYIERIQDELFNIFNNSKKIVVKIFIIKKNRINIKRKILSGTGFYFKKDYIVTNFHVVKKACNVIVESFDKEEYFAKIIGFDEIHDICILKCNKSKEKVLCCNSNDLKVGQFAVAIGMPMGLEFTPTIGIISSLSHSIRLNNNEIFNEIIQFSGKLTSGNSGGPLISSNLEIIGMNTYSLCYEDDISFAIKIDYVLKVANNIINEYERGLFE